MPSDIPADVAYIGGVWCEGVLYGIHVILFGALCNICLRKSFSIGRHISSQILLTLSTSMFILSTAHVALALHELLQGFVYEGNVPGGPPVFFRVNVFPQRKAVYIINTLLGDSILVWRLYVIWDRNWKIAAPSFLLFLGTSTCGIKTIVANAITPAESVFVSDILSWVTSTFVLTIATQISATVLIAARIYYISNLTVVDSRSRSRYMAVVWAVVESGAVYTAAALVQLVTYLLKMNVGVILEFMLGQLSAMVPILIVVRVALGVAYDGSTTTKRDIEFTTINTTALAEKDVEASVTFEGSEIPNAKKQSNEGLSRSSIHGQPG